MKLSAILFDLDGTLTDSTRLFHDAVDFGMQSIGVAMELPVFNQWHSNHEHWEYLLTKHGVDGTKWETVERATFEKFHELIGTVLVWNEGAKETVETLKHRGMPIAIVSNSRDEFVDTMDKSLGLKTLFPLIITSTIMKERSKPDPYGLLLAAEKLGVSPGECLYIGDQKFDMQAAHAAGMHDCLFKGSHTPADVELMAKHVVHSIPELLTLID